MSDEAWTKRVRLKKTQHFKGSVRCELGATWLGTSVGPSMSSADDLPVFGVMLTARISENPGCEGTVAVPIAREISVTRRPTEAVGNHPPRVQGMNDVVIGVVKDDSWHAPRER